MIKEGKRERNRLPSNLFSDLRGLGRHENSGLEDGTTEVKSLHWVCTGKGQGRHTRRDVIRSDVGTLQSPPTYGTGYRESETHRIRKVVNGRTGLKRYSPKTTTVGGEPQRVGALITPR